MTRRSPGATLGAVNPDRLGSTVARAHRGTIRDAASPRRDAMRDVVAVAPALLPFGIALGIVIASSRIGDAAGLLGAPLVYGGSAQLTAITMFQQGAGLLAIVGSAITVNARLLLYSASLAPRFNAQPAWFRITAPHFIIDQTYLSASGRPNHSGHRFRTYWLTLGLGVMAVWSAAVGTGVLLGPRLPSLPHLTLAGTALFVGMLMPRIRNRPTLAAAVTAGAVAPLVAQVLPTAGVLVGAAAGMIAGAAAGKGGSA